MMLLRASVLALLAGACGDGGGFPDAPGPPDATPMGTMSLDWSVVKMADGSPIGCAQVGGVTVTLVLRNRAVQGGFTEVFSCNTGRGTTPMIPIGTYDVRFELTGVTGVIAMGEEQQGVVVGANRDTPLMPVTFRVNAIGGLDLRIDALKAGGNCAPVANNGAGIAEMSITLNHASGGACEPAVLTIGTTPPRTYTINCGAPTRTPCFDTATAVTASGLPSDNYIIHVRGYQQMGSMTACYVNDDSIRVPPNAMSLMRTLNLAATGAVGCL